MKWIKGNDWVLVVNFLLEGCVMNIGVFIIIVFYVSESFLILSVIL